MLAVALPLNIMRLIAAAIPLVAFASFAAAQTAEPQPSGGSPREVALDNLLSERDSQQDLDAVVEAARKAGISGQAILEARFLYHVDRREDDAVAAMLPEFLKRRDEFKLEDSAIFAVKEDWLAVVEYVQAIAKLKSGDKAGFKTHITEAFWLSPRQASAFAPHIDRVRLEEAMRTVTIDFETKLPPLDGGEAVTLKSLMSDRKATLLHFWSPASQECAASMPDYVATAKALGGKGVSMVSIIPENSPELLTKARDLVRPLGDKPPGAWLIDSKDHPLARLLRVQTLPAFVLVSNDGRVLFNGDPSDDGLWDALAKLDERITRPASPGAQD